MPETTPKVQQWLSLREAADRLSVHPTTLRRWADKGEIPVMVTPGGHRRFSTSDIDSFSEERRHLRMVSGLEQMWADHALSQARSGILSHRGEHWLAAFDDEDRERKRQLGRRLMGLIFQYVSLSQGGDDLLAEAQVIGREHAENALAMHMPLTEAMQAMLFFRDTLVEVAVQLPTMAHVRPEANTRLLRRINTLLNAVQLSIAEVYDQGHR